MAGKPEKSDDGRTRRKSLRLHGMVARNIGILIVTARYRPGDVLDGEIEASERLNISRSAYREAIRILAAKGLVEVRPKTGTRVSPRERWHLLDPDVLSWIFRYEPEEELLQSLFELRKIVEPAAAAMAAERRTDEHVAAMAEALQTMEEQSLATEEGRLADETFHATLLAATRNPFLISLTSGVGAAVAQTTLYKLRHRPLPRDPTPDHRRVHDAIVAKDGAGARRAMEELIDMALLDTTTTPRVDQEDGRARRAR